jgi:hypothetical protein
MHAHAVFRAALDNLQAWLEDGTPPPSSIYIDIPAEPSRTLGDEPFWDAARDADGNARGGIRLPHMPGLREGAGAPLGEYRGIKEGAAFRPTAGYFRPFSGDEIRARYPDRAAYVEAVRAAAEDLVANRYILQDDANAYVREAEAAPFWIEPN